jgi:hypothetical protein
LSIYLLSVYILLLGLDHINELEETKPMLSLIYKRDFIKQSTGGLVQCAHFVLPIYIFSWSVLYTLLHYTKVYAASVWI